jgi:hypothetical protein
MSRLLYGIGVAALLSSVTFGQSVAHFDVADVHIRPTQQPGPVRRQVHTRATTSETLPCST